MGPEHGEQPRWNRPSLQRRWAIYRRIGPTSQHFGPTSQHFRAANQWIEPASSLRRRTAWTARTDRAERTDRTEQSGLTDQAEQAGWTQ
jgi:hypothetical protein